MQQQRFIRSRTILALTGMALVSILLAAWLLAVKGEVSRGEPEDLRLPAPQVWEYHQATEVTANGVTVAGKRFHVSDTGMAVEFWLLVRDPVLQDSQVRLVEVSLHTKETEYTSKDGGAVLAGGGIHLAEASFSGYDFATSHPIVPGRNKELSLSIQALEVLNPDNSIRQIIKGPWETVVAVKNDAPGRQGSGESLLIGKLSQSQLGVTVRLRPGAGVGYIEPYEVIQKDKETRFLPLGAGPRIIPQEEYEAAVKEAAEIAAKGPRYNWPTPAPSTPEPPSGPLNMGSQTGNAIVEVGSASIPQGQQAQVPVTVKGVNDPDGLADFDLKITYNPAVVTVSGGQPPFSGTPTYKADNTTGQVLFTATQGSIPGPTGDIIVAYVTLQAVGSPGASTVLDITITNLGETANADEIPAVDQDGAVTIVP